MHPDSTRPGATPPFLRQRPSARPAGDTKAPPTPSRMAQPPGPRPLAQRQAAAVAVTDSGYIPIGQRRDHLLSGTAVADFMAPFVAMAGLARRSPLQWLFPGRDGPLAVATLGGEVAAATVGWGWVLRRAQRATVGVIDRALERMDRRGIEARALTPPEQLEWLVSQANRQPLTPAGLRDVVRRVNLLGSRHPAAVSARAVADAIARLAAHAASPVSVTPVASCSSARAMLSGDFMRADFQGMEVLRAALADMAARELLSPQAHAPRLVQMAISCGHSLAKAIQHEAAQSRIDLSDQWARRFIDWLEALDAPVDVLNANLLDLLHAWELVTAPAFERIYRRTLPPDATPQQQLDHLVKCVRHSPNGVQNTLLFAMALAHPLPLPLPACALGQLIGHCATVAEALGQDLSPVRMHGLLAVLRASRPLMPLDRAGWHALYRQALTQLAWGGAGPEARALALGALLRDVGSRGLRGHLAGTRPAQWCEALAAIAPGQVADLAAPLLDAAADLPAPLDGLRAWLDIADTLSARSDLPDTITLLGRGLVPAGKLAGMALAVAHAAGDRPVDADADAGLDDDAGAAHDLAAAQALARLPLLAQGTLGPDGLREVVGLIAGLPGLSLAGPDGPGRSARAEALQVLVHDAFGHASLVLLQADAQHLAGPAKDREGAIAAQVAAEGERRRRELRGDSKGLDLRQEAQLLEELDALEARLRGAPVQAGLREAWMTTDFLLGLVDHAMAVASRAE